MTAITTTDYVIYLGGSTNAYNSGPGPVGIQFGMGRTAAEREIDAIERFQDEGMPVYNGQYLYARPYSRCSAEDKDAAQADQEERNFRLSQALASVR